MHKQLALWQSIYNNLQQNIAVMLLYVLESNGSSPGRQGFAMCVNELGDMKGSIGGGIMEHKFVEMAKERFKLKAESLKLKAEIRKQFHDKVAAKNQSGMICSGDQTILIYLVKKEDETSIKNIIDCLKKNRNGLLELTPNSLQFDVTIVPEKDYLFKQETEDNWQYEEKLGYKNNLYIIGGGHCSLALSNLFKNMDFNIFLFEERAGLNTLLENNSVHKKHVVETYESLTDIKLQGSNNYVVIMTVGYRTDAIAVKALIKKPFKYIGLLGSAKKVERLFSDLKNEGINQQIISQIYSPIGLQINSQTPEEIAISIAAEIIKIKNS